MADDLAAIAARVSNWGRWGPDDQRGTLNLIDDAARVRGLAAVRRGTVFSLAIPFDTDGPQLGNIPGRNNPELTRSSVNAAWSGDPSHAAWSDDHLDMGVQAATHWDTLAHCGYDGLLYNGTSNAVVSTEEGATRMGAETLGPIVSRGVVLDVVRALGLDDRLPPAYEITAADLEAALALAGVTVQPGDVALLRTGQMVVWRDRGHNPYSQKSPGPGVDTIEWFADHQWGAVAADNLPFEPVDVATSDYSFPVQRVLLRDVGLLLGQLWDLDALADDCAAHEHRTCLLVANPLPLTHGIGAPVAPVAIT
ncbi:MAG: putative cyclase [Actinomycetia bacterium]|nr:putative cyclase [Actinomycetes bacterium]